MSTLNVYFRASKLLPSQNASEISPILTKKRLIDKPEQKDEEAQEEVMEVGVTRPPSPRSVERMCPSASQALMKLQDKHPLYRARRGVRPQTKRFQNVMLGR